MCLRVSSCFPSDCLPVRKEAPDPIRALEHSVRGRTRTCLSCLKTDAREAPSLASVPTRGSRRLRAHRAALRRRPRACLAPHASRDALDHSLRPFAARARTSFPPRARARGVRVLVGAGAHRVWRRGRGRRTRDGVRRLGRRRAPPRRGRPLLRRFRRLRAPAPPRGRARPARRPRARASFPATRGRARPRRRVRPRRVDRRRGRAPRPDRRHPRPR